MLDAFFKDSFMNFKISIFIRVIEFKKLILNRTSCKCQIEVKWSQIKSNKFINHFNCENCHQGFNESQTD